jgi:hypothetical protein
VLVSQSVSESTLQILTTWISPRVNVYRVFTSRRMMNTNVYLYAFSQLEGHANTSIILHVSVPPNFVDHWTLFPWISGWVGEDRFLGLSALENRLPCVFAHSPRSYFLRGPLATCSPEFGHPCCLRYTISVRFKNLKFFSFSNISYLAFESYINFRFYTYL